MQDLIKVFNTYRRSGKLVQKDLRAHKKALTKSLHKLLDKDFSRKALSDEGHFQVLDFFSGAGGMTAGFAMLAKMPSPYTSYILTHISVFLVVG